MSSLQEMKKTEMTVIPAKLDSTRHASFVITVRMPSRARWIIDPMQIAFTIRNVVKQWLKNAIASDTDPLVDVTPVTFVDEQREKAIAFELLKAGGFVTKQKAAQVLRIARGLK